MAQIEAEWLLRRATEELENTSKTNGGPYKEVHGRWRGPHDRKFHSARFTIGVYFPVIPSVVCPMGWPKYKKYTRATA